LGREEYVANFDSDDPELPPDTFYFMPSKPWITSSAQVTHILALAGNANSGQLLVYVELFNLAKVAVLLPYAGTTDMRQTFSIDVLSGKEAAVQIDEQVLISVPWQGTHQLGDAELYAFTAGQFRRLITIAREREWNAAISQIVERAFGPADGRRLAPLDFANLVAEIATFVKEAWKDPSYLSELRQQDLLRFGDLCQKFENMVPPMGRAEFRRLIGPHRSALAEAAKAS
jgi:hypothetical protein